MQDGALRPSLAAASLLVVVPALMALLGRWVRVRVSAETFRLCFFAGSLVLGAHLALRAVI